MRRLGAWARHIGTAGLLAVSCSAGDSRDDGLAIESSLSADRALSGLAVEERRDLCLAAADAVFSVLGYPAQVFTLCSLQASAVAEVNARGGAGSGDGHFDPAECAMLRDACIAQTDENANAARRPTGEMDWRKTCTGWDPPFGLRDNECTASVAAYERCLTATLRQLQDTRASYDCSTGMTPMTTTADEEALTECRDLERACGKLQL